MPESEARELELELASAAERLNESLVRWFSTIDLELRWIREALEAMARQEADRG